MQDTTSYTVTLSNPQHHMSFPSTRFLKSSLLHPSVMLSTQLTTSQLLQNVFLKTNSWTSAISYCSPYNYLTQPNRSMWHVKIIFRAHWNRCVELSVSTIAIAVINRINHLISELWITSEICMHLHQHFSQCYTTECFEIVLASKQSWDNRN